MENGYPRVNFVMDLSEACSTCKMKTARLNVNFSYRKGSLCGATNHLDMFLLPNFYRLGNRADRKVLQNRPKWTTRWKFPLRAKRLQKGYSILFCFKRNFFFVNVSKNAFSANTTTSLHARSAICQFSDVIIHVFNCFNLFSPG